MSLIHNEYAVIAANIYKMFAVGEMLEDYS